MRVGGVVGEAAEWGGGVIDQRAALLLGKHTRQHARGLAATAVSLSISLSISHPVWRVSQMAFRSAYACMRTSPVSMCCVFYWGGVEVVGYSIERRRRRQQQRRRSMRARASTPLFDVDAAVVDSFPPVARSSTPGPLADRTIGLT